VVHNGVMSRWRVRISLWWGTARGRSATGG